MKWAQKHRLWHVLGTIVVLAGLAFLAFCGKSRPLGVQQVPAHDAPESPDDALPAQPEPPAASDPERASLK